MLHKIPFIVAELGPNVDPFMLHIYAAVAEKERALISQRTKAALARAKIVGTKSGKPIGNPRAAELSSKGVAAFKADADRAAARVLPIISQLKAEKKSPSDRRGTEPSRV